ncbi:MAG: lipoyl synthase [Anaerolineales bacterium]|nr:lipoyl synthase [Anaerolineales bacterium]
MAGMKPDWLAKPFPQGERLVEVGKVLSTFKLHTVCQSALCPNLGECFSRGTATFMIMGDICTRNCRFCAVEKGKPTPLDPGEPARIARAVKELGLSYVVVTSVTRDDLADGGANHFAQTIAAMREVDRDIKVEVLIPDLGSSREALEVVVNAKPDVINHNVETVPRLYDQVRPKADYLRSLEIIQSVKELNTDIRTKSGMMLGLGETEEEILAVMQDLCRVDCDLLTLGQYLSPSEGHLPVARYIPPEEFQKIAAKGQRLGFLGIAAGPFVRSSYRADELLLNGRSLN